MFGLFGIKYRLVEYHSKEWEILVSLGWITMYILDDGKTARMIYQP
jgi:hypothetical protein